MFEALKNLLGTQFGTSVVFLLFSLAVMMTAVAYCIYFERKVSAWIQDRYGPNRVGRYGLLQPLADGIKMLLKEDYIPRAADRALFLFAPAMAFVVAMIGFAVIPFGGRVRWPWMAEGQSVAVQGASIDIGLLYILAVGSMAVYGVVLGGWSSNNKYAFYGSMRAAAQMLSYEVPLGLAVLIVILTTGALRLEEMVEVQRSGTWNVLLHPVAFVMMLTTALAETNRAPFDLTEAEQELVGGYHTEYSALKFGLFFLGEYAHIITASGLMTAMFFGGWEPIPWTRHLAGAGGLTWLNWIAVSASPGAMLLRLLIFGAKVSFFVFLFMWIRWTLPRFRFDQLMRLAWKALVPLGVALVIVQGVLVYVGRPVHWISPAAEFAVLAAGGLLGAWCGRRVTGRQASLPQAPGHPATN